MMLLRWVSSKSRPWISMPLASAASRTGRRTSRPITLHVPSPPSAVAPATATSAKPYALDARPQPSASRIRSLARCSTGAGISSNFKPAANSASVRAGLVAAAVTEILSSMLQSRFGLSHIVDETAVSGVEGKDRGTSRRERAARIGAQVVGADLDDVFDMRTEIHAADDVTGQAVLACDRLRRSI